MTRVHQLYLLVDVLSLSKSINVEIIIITGVEVHELYLLSSGEPLRAHPLWALYHYHQMTKILLATVKNAIKFLDFWWKSLRCVNEFEKLYFVKVWLGEWNKDELRRDLGNFTLGVQKLTSDPANFLACDKMAFFNEIKIFCKTSI